ncbi:MAG: hypothetical protein LBR55_01300 [Bacteroidales bacterium]|jgi:phosphate-selective porin OprO/OprP|nr:hypothetical protein [Bacteroidales bacterium]
MKKLLVSIACISAMSAFAQVDSNDSAAVDAYPLQAQAQKNILTFENKEKGYKFWMDNRVQFDGAKHFGLKNGMLVDGEPAMTGGVSLRRVRLAVKAQVTKDWYGEVDANFANGGFELEDAYIMYSGLKNFAFKAGNFKEDFSMERTTSSRYIMFMERPMAVQMFAPARHTGLQANWQKYGWLRASAGISWQMIENADTYYNVTEFNKQGRPMGTNYSGKIVFMPWAAQDFYGLHIGYNGSYRDSRKTDDDRDGAEALGRGYEGNYFSTRNATYVSRLKFMSTEYYGVKYDYLQGIELAGYKDGFRFQGEFIANHSIMDSEKIDKYNETPKQYNYDGLVANKETKFFYGFYAEAAYLLFGGKQYYDITESEFKRPTRGKSWGDIEVMARYDYLNLNSQDLYGGSGENYTLGVTYHVNNNVKLMMNYQYSRNDVYANNKGKAVVGRDVNGEYTSNPKLAATDRGIAFNAIQARIEIAF